MSKKINKDVIEKLKQNSTKLVVEFEDKITHEEARKRDIIIYTISFLIFLAISTIIFIVPYSIKKHDKKVEVLKGDNIILQETIDLLETKVQEQYDIVLEKNAENKELKEDVENLETLIELIASHYDLEGEEFELWLFINHREIYDWLVKR